jgi:outer membrane protein insertion porin family
VASLHTSLGYMQPIGVPIPIDELFYLGGIGSLRGYPVRTVSPYLSTVMTPTDYLGVGSSNVNHIFLGGQAEAVANLEYTFPIMKDLGLKGVIFFDAGNSADTIKNTFSGILTSYGAGLRWLSPMGPLRIEYGIPLEPRPGIDSPSGRLEFSMGSIF